MDSVIAEIDEEIRQLRELKLLASNPRMLERMRRLFLPDGTSAVGALNQEQPQPQQHSRPRRVQPQPAAPRGTLLNTVLSACNDIEGAVTVTTVMDKLKEGGFHFSAKEPRVALSGALRKLAARGQIKVIERGKGSAESKYKRLPPASA